MLSRTELANCLRILSIDAIEAANSGHPGAPLGMADIAEVLWNDFLRHNPNNPHWIDRDRFVLSNGHGSMLLYALLHLSGYDITLEELKRFRQLNSLTPGHPEYGYTPGVETTTGPLGQGIANAVGMAIAERTLAAQYNREDFDIINHYTYVTVGDGCLMEGVSHEACSLAGTMGLGKLIALYDSNQISIDGDVSGWFTEDIPGRFNAYRWHVIDNVDGHDPDQIRQAITAARAVTDKPSLICCKTIIGKGSPNKQGLAESHGAPLGEAEVALTREALGWKHEPFVIPKEYYLAWDVQELGESHEQEWREKFELYRSRYPVPAEDFERRVHGSLPNYWQERSKIFIAGTTIKQENIASRKASQNALNAYGPLLTELIGGSADLTGSNLTQWSSTEINCAETPGGNYIYYGVREFGMAAINNGIALHGGFIPYGGTFLMFSEYARNALRMAALMKLRSIYVFTHDSIGLGEDGPTHQAVEQASTLRVIPNMSVWRPCDAVETAVAWRAAIEKAQGPTSLLLSRQNLPHVDRSEEQLENIQRGGYILMDCPGDPAVIIIATGSEVSLALNVAAELNQSGANIRVISMPCTDIFDVQDESYRNDILPSTCRNRIAIEAGHPDYWRKYVGLDGKVLGVSTFGESAPAAEVYKHFGLTEEDLTAAVESFL